MTSAKALDGAMAKEVEGALNGFLKKGQKAQITFSVSRAQFYKRTIYTIEENSIVFFIPTKIFFQVDPALVGGMVVSIDDKFCDMSMSSKLNKYSELLKAAA